MSVENRGIVVITGVSSGLGLAMAYKFRAEGFYVIGVSRSEPPKDSVDTFISTDITDAVARQNCVKNIIDKHGAIDVLINNAGIGSYSPWEELDEADLRKLMDIDFFAPVEFSKLFAGSINSGSGAIINIASVASYVPVACMGAYNAGKAALAMYSKTLRMELASREINVLNVCPGRIDTGFSKRAVGKLLPPATSGSKSSSAEALAKVVYKGYVKRRREVVYPSWYKLVINFSRRFPGVVERINRRLWNLDD